MKVVDEFITSEQSKLNWLEKLLSNDPKFYVTNDFELTTNDYYDVKPNVVIKPSLLIKVAASFFIILGLIFWLIILNMVLQNILFPITIAFLILVTAWLGLILWAFFLNPKYSYNLFLDKNELRISKLCLKWDKVLEVLIMVKGGGRHTRKTLVIFTNDNSVFQYSLNNFDIPNERVLKLIKLYRG